MKNRRNFIKTSIAATLGGTLAPITILNSCKGKNKLNIAFIGVGGRAQEALQILWKNPKVNFIAFADVDEDRASQVYEMLPDIPKFKDFRKMLDEFGKQIDAVVISTPDHTHHYIAKTCMLQEKHVFVEKPLVHNAYEAKELYDLEKKLGLVCQMGNQGHSGSGLKHVNEWVSKGYLGDVTEAYAWNGAGWNNADAKRPAPEPIPKGLDWDLWLGPTKEIPYSSKYMPFNWRGWNQFGSGLFGDWACHNMDAPYTALELDYPEKIEIKSSGPSKLSFPYNYIITFVFPTSKTGNPVRLSWYQGKDYLPPIPDGMDESMHTGGGCVMLGSKSSIFVGSWCTGPRFIPETKNEEMKPLFSDFKNEEHYNNWVDACFGLCKPNSPFSYGARLSEIITLGTLALKLDTNLELDPQARKIINNPLAQELAYTPTIRKGWEI